MLCMPPSHWIAPYVGFPTYDHLKAYFKKVNDNTPPGQGCMFIGLDRSLQGVPQLTRQDLDVYFPDRAIAIVDNSGYEIYFNTHLIKLLKWEDLIPPPDPAGSRYGRAADGTSDGRGYEVGVEIVIFEPILSQLYTNPLSPSAKWYKFMAENGIHPLVNTRTKQAWVKLTVPCQLCQIVPCVSIFTTCLRKVTQPTSSTLQILKCFPRLASSCGPMVVHGLVLLLQVIPTSTLSW
jgi:hypothetical protein